MPSYVIRNILPLLAVEVQHESSRNLCLIALVLFKLELIRVLHDIHHLSPVECRRLRIARENMLSYRMIGKNGIGRRNRDKSSSKSLVDLSWSSILVGLRVLNFVSIRSDDRISGSR